MKSLITSCLILLFSTQLLSQTTDEIPSPERVLVVFRENHPYSESIADDYIEKRNIPLINKVPITITDPGNYGCKFQWNDEEIVDTTLQGDGGWHYVKEVIADTIEYYLNTTVYNGQPLKNIIRYIVLCKGMPLKVRDDIDWGPNGVAWKSLYRNRVSVDALLCLINQPDGRSFVNLHGQLYSSYENPYFEADPNLSMNYRFVSNHFVNPQGWYLQYLVSRLDADNLDDVDSLINRSANPDMNGDKYWIIDDDPKPAAPGTMAEAHFKLNSFGFNLNPTIYVNTIEWIVNNAPTYEPVIGYVSHGRNTAYSDPTRPRMPATYILDTLDFDYTNGAIFSSQESFNGYSFGVTRADHGLVSDFIHMGGTGGGGHVYEPFSGGVSAEKIVFPAYALGYSLVEAIYQGSNFIAWQNTVVGDPLTRIYECENTVFSTNTIIYSEDFDCDVTIAPGVTLTVSSGSTVNINKNAELHLYGNLELENGATINFNGIGTHEFTEHISVVSGIAYLNFNGRRTLTINNIENFDNFHFTFSGESKLYIPNNLTLNASLNHHLEFLDKSKIFLEGTMNIIGYDVINFYGNSEMIIDGTLNVNTNCDMSFKDNSRMRVNNSINLEPGSIMNFDDNSIIDVLNSLFIQGEATNNVIFNFSNSNTIQFYFHSSENILNISYTTFNNGELYIQQSHHFPAAESITITNSIFNGCYRALIISQAGYAPSITPIISNCFFNNIVSTGIELTQVKEFLIQHCIIDLNSSSDSKGIVFSNIGEVYINDVTISDGGIGVASRWRENNDIELIEDLLMDIYISQCVIETDLGISLNGIDFPFNSITVQGNHFATDKNGIAINDFADYEISITENVMVGNYNGSSKMGIVLTNGDEAFISNNSITGYLTGISLFNVANPYIIENTISAIDLTVEPLSGITAVSSQGQIRLNTIQNHLYGIELGSASPKIGANTIINNKAYGIYISDNSNPDLSGSFVGDDQFPLSGYNTIRENGSCEETQNSELYLLNSFVRLEKGCNTIADDRDGIQQQCNNLYLVDGRKIPESIIQAKANYWGNHPVYGNDPTGRFGEEVTIDYSDFLPEPCTYSQGEAELILANSKGVVYDTVYSTGNTATGLSDIESRYAMANNYYYNNQYPQAKQEYEGIIQNYGNNNESIQAYNRLYTIANLTNSSPSVFSQLKDFYLQKAANQTDSLMIGTLEHLSDLCLVAAEEYLPAINNFDEIAQQNPNTDIALYRQIDALTTSLLMPQDSTLNKGLLGKYSVANISDYTNKLSELLKTRGKSGLETEKELLPTEYTLYQNYPNPFNPITTIKYDLPNTSDVMLAVYDILGKKVKELVNTKQQAGRYEVKFNASNLASGVYIYQLVAEKNISSKKMILLK